MARPVSGGSRDADPARLTTPPVLYRELADWWPFLSTLDDLRSVLGTARAHCKPGGVALFASEGLFSKSDWTRLMEVAGFEARIRALQRSDFPVESVLFLGVAR